jgi:hypothetical protein
MSDDIATLGLAIDSSQVKTASTALATFQTAANGAGLAARTFQTSAQGSSAGLSSFQTSLNQAVGDLTVLAVAQKNGTSASDENTESIRGQSQVLRAISTDLAVFGGSMGQVAGTAGLLYTENAHLIEGFGGFKSVISGILTPGNILVGVLAAIATGAALTVDSIIKEGAAFSDLADKTDSTSQSLQQISKSATGLSTTDFTTGLQQFATLSVQAKDNIGSLAGLLHANGDAAGTMVDDLAQVADLVKNATSDAQKYNILTEAGLPATQQWVQWLSQGGAAIKAAATAISPVNLAQQQLIDTAKQFDQEWTDSWKSFKADAQDAALSTIGYFQGLGATIRGEINSVANAGGWDNAYQSAAGASLLKQGQGTQLKAQDANNIYDNVSSSFKAQTSGGGSSSGKSTITLADAQKQIQDQQEYIGLLGQQASVSDIVKQKQLELQAASLNGVNVTEAQRNSILSYTQAEALGTLQIQASIDTVNTQAQAIGMGAGATAAFTAAQNLLNEAQRNGKTLTADNINQINQYAQSLGVATQAAAVMKLQSDANFTTSQLGRSDSDQGVATAMRSLYGNDYVNEMNSALAGQIRMNDLLGQTKNAAGSAFSQFLQDLASGKSGIQSLTDGLTGFENKLFDVIGNQAASALFKGGTSIFSGIFGSTPTSAPGAPLNILPTNHTGYGPGDMQTTFRTVSGSMLNWPRHHDGIGPGEHGAVIRDDESVLTPGQMKALAPASRAGNSGGGAIVNVNNFSGQQIQQTKRTDSNGLDIVDIMVGQANRRMAKGDFDSSLRSRPGGRQPIARR